MGDGGGIPLSGAGEMRAEAERKESSAKAEQHAREKGEQILGWGTLRQRERERLRSHLLGQNNTLKHTMPLVEFLTHIRSCTTGHADDSIGSALHGRSTMLCSEKVLPGRNSAHITLWLAPHNGLK